MHISVSKGPILQGWRDTTTVLWRVPLQPIFPPPKCEFTSHNKDREDAIENVYKLPSAKKSIQYIHACSGLPTKSYWIKAIKGGNYATWPNLTAEAVKQHFPESNETNQCHMRGSKQNIRSTGEKKQPLTYQLDNGYHSPSHSKNTRIFTYQSTTWKRQCTPIKPARFLSLPRKGINILWSYVKLTTMS